MKFLKKIVAIGLIGSILIIPAQAKTLVGITKANTTLVPLRTISEEIGAEVAMDNQSKLITLIYEDQEVMLKPDDAIAMVNGEPQELIVAPVIVNGTTYVPLRFLGEALGGTMTYDAGKVVFEIEDVTKEWTLQTTPIDVPTIHPFKREDKTINGKTVRTVTINTKDPRVSVDIATGDGHINVAQSLESMTNANNGYASINGTYFAAYNGDMPLPDGTLVKDGEVLHITDIGSTVGFTPDGEVLIDFVTTRVQGYINGEPAFITYRVNRPTPDTSATVMFTKEYKGAIPLEEGWTAIVCEDGKVTKKVTTAVEVPQNGFILTTPTSRSDRFNIGDEVTYEVTFAPENTSEEKWQQVTHALSAGPSLIINGEITGDPREEKFTESKILTQSATRSFIGVTKDDEVVIGTTVATIDEMKQIAKAMELKGAMCVDGGASSGLYFNGAHVTTPGRTLNNSIQFKFNN